MKRKFKIFGAIASLCMAITLMAFGVYAASTTDFNINGSVQYVINEVLVEITADISTNELATGTEGYATLVSENPTDESEFGACDSVYTGSNVIADFNSGDNIVEDSVENNLAEVFEYSTKLTVYKFAFNVKNNNDFDLKVATSFKKTGDSTDNLCCYYGTDRVVAVDSSETINVYMYMTSFTTAVEGDFTISLTIAQNI